MFGSRKSRPADAAEWEPPNGTALADPMVPNLIVLFGLRTCWFESFPFDIQLPRIEAGRIVLPPEEPGVAGWSGEVGVELPVRYGDFTLGRYVLVPATPTCGVGLSVTAREHAIAMADEVGARIAQAIVAEADRART